MGNKIRLIRQDLELTLREVSQKVGCSISFLSDLERGNRTAKRSTLRRIATALGVTVEDLKGDDNEASND